jgi:type II secretion system protein G
MSKKGFTLIELLIVVAIIAILAAIAVPNFLEAQTRSKVSRVKADLRSLATALEAYYIDNNTYPAQASSMSPGANALPDVPTTPPSARFMPTFRIKLNGTDNLMTLTTPVAYITSYFADPFSDSKGAIFNYSMNDASPGSAGISGPGWILWSYGPDTDEKIANGGSGNTGGSIDVIDGTSNDEPPVVAETMYNPSIAGVSEGLSSVTYDPTNGTTSNGDVYRLKQ